MPMSAAPPVSARAKEPGSGATFEPGFDGLVTFPKLNLVSDAWPLELGMMYLTIIGDVESLI